MSQKDLTTTQRNNNRIVIYCLTFAAFMLAMSFAAVPLYQIFCQVTGYGGTTQRVEQVADRILDREITIRFDSNIQSSLDWDFKAKTREVTLKLGETSQIEYFSKNIGNIASTGSATFNVTPEAAGAYFNKLACFCFTETTLQAGEEMDMPVLFFIDPDLDDVRELDALTTITLSYTFFEVEKSQDKVAKSVKGIDSSMEKL